MKVVVVGEPVELVAQCPSDRNSCPSLSEAERASVALQGS